MIEKGERIASFDALRVYACFAVMAYHAQFPAPGFSGLSVFFVMSGFLSVYNHFGDGETAQLGLRGSLRFSRGKIKKLYPLHLVMMAYPFSTQLYRMLHGLFSPMHFFTNLAANALLVHAWIPLTDYYFSFNVPSWYLSVMMFLYFMLPFILRCMEKYRSRRTAFMTALVVFLLQIVSSVAAEKIYIAAAKPDPTALESFYQWFVQVFPLYRLGDFAIGANLAYFFLYGENRSLSQTRATVMEVLAILLVVPAQLAYLHAVKNSTCIFLVSSAALVYTFALNEGYISKILTNRVIKHFAALSADIYLIHFQVIIIAIELLHLPFGTGAQKAFFLCFVFGATYLLALLTGAIRKKYRRLCN